MVDSTTSDRAQSIAAAAERCSVVLLPRREPTRSYVTATFFRTEEELAVAAIKSASPSDHSGRRDIVLCGVKPLICDTLTPKHFVCCIDAAQYTEKVPLAASAVTRLASPNDSITIMAQYLVSDYAVSTQLPDPRWGDLIKEGFTLVKASAEDVHTTFKKYYPQFSNTHVIVGIGTLKEAITNYATEQDPAVALEDCVLLIEADQATFMRKYVSRGEASASCTPPSKHHRIVLVTGGLTAWEKKNV